MPRLVWSDEAVHDLDRVYAFLAKKSIDAAVAAIKVIRKKSSLLEKFPNAGRPAADLEPEHRELIIPFGAAGYILLYRVEEDTVYILGLMHQREVGWDAY